MPVNLPFLSLQSVKIILGQKKIEIGSLHYVSSLDQAEVKVDGIVHQVKQQYQILEGKDGQPAAVLQCDSIECSLYSEKHGLYVSVSKDRVKVEVSKRQELSYGFSFTCLSLQAGLALEHDH